jgi:hypothetical protein
MGDKVYRTRVDAWLVALLIGATATPLAAAAWLAASGQTEGLVLLLVWGTAVSALVISLTVPVRYTLRGDALVVRSGWLRWTIPWAAVRRVEPTWNPLAGPAWSLRRVRLDWDQGNFILVSPQDRESFIEDIAARCPHLTRAGARLEFRPPSR